MAATGRREGVDQGRTSDIGREGMVNDRKRKGEE